MASSSGFIDQAARNRLARKIITTSTKARPTITGTPTSSAKPVSGKAEGVGVAVCCSDSDAAWVNKAATVAVRFTVGVTNTSVG